MNPPANWYPDPTGRHGQRYWDGEQWTEHVFTDGVQGVDPLDAGRTQEESGQAETAEQTEPAAADAESHVGGAQGDMGDAQGEEAGADASETTWTPDDQDDQDDASEQAVAPEVEPEDVVGTLDEVADGDTAPEQDATTPTTSDATEEGVTTDRDGHPETPAEDFSDAFMVTPETVSRLVSRQATPAPEQTTGEPSAAPPGSAQPGADEDGPQALFEEPQQAEPAAGPGTEQGSGGPPAEQEAGSAVPIDAPPPDMPAPTAAAPSPASESQGGLGISGDLVDGAFAEREHAGPVALQNPRLLRCSLAGDGPGVIARQGTMVAYQGEVTFERQGAGGVTRALKRAATGEGLAMMRSEGTGDVFFADGAQHVFLLHLDGGAGISVNGRNVLAFSAALQWDIERVKGATLLAGGLFNTTLTGTGWIALVSDGEPVVLGTADAPTYVDVNALVAWSGGLSTRIANTVSAKSLVGLGSGEAFQMAFEGSGIVIVQPSEGSMGGAGTA